MRRPPNTPEFRNFTVALGDILKVSKDEIKTRIEAQKEGGKRLPKGFASLDSAVSSKIRAAFED